MANQPSRPYNEWLYIARRWDKAIDFESPISAWTSAMLREYRIAKEEQRKPDMNNCR